MGQIKSYTDISQSKKLAEILPIESADMYWIHGKLDYVKQYPTPYIIGNAHGEPLWDEFDIPCWSLEALLGVIKTYYSRLEITLRANKNYNIFAVSGDFVFRSFDECSEGYNNIVDACVVMVEKLHELNLL